MKLNFEFSEVNLLTFLAIMLIGGIIAMLSICSCVDCSPLMKMFDSKENFGNILDENSFSMVKEFFSNFIIGKMDNIHETAINIWEKCYGWSIDYKDNGLFDKNENTNKKKLLIEDISQEAREQFLQKTEWDRKLYAYLSQK